VFALQGTDPLPFKSVESELPSRELGERLGHSCCDLSLIHTKKLSHPQTGDCAGRITFAKPVPPEKGPSLPLRWEAASAPGPSGWRAEGCGGGRGRPSWPPALPPI